MTTSRCPKTDDDDIGMRLHPDQRKSIFQALMAAATAEVIYPCNCITRSHADDSDRLMWSTRRLLVGQCWWLGGVSMLVLAAGSRHHRAVMSFVVDVLSNLVANVAFWGLLGIVFWGFGRASHARFLRFLALHESSSVTVMLSNLWQPKASGRKIGFTISRHEQLAAQAISSFLGQAPGRLPDMVRWLVDQLWLRTRPQCMVDRAVPDTRDQ